MEQSLDQAYKNRKLILLNIVCMIFMATLDGSIVNVALPKMAVILSVSAESVAWVVSAYLIVISGTILVFGKLGDIKGKVKIFQFGIIIFTFGSLLCGLADSFIFLIIARAVQAVGGAGAMATSQGIITQVFPSKERGKALGICGTFVALGSMTGPPLGGLIVDALSWKYIFLINVPIGIFVYIMGTRVLPKSMREKAGKLDIKGSVLFALSIVLLFGSLTMGEHIGFANPVILAAFAVAVVLFIIFIHLQKRVESPLLNLQIFENKLFSLSILCAFIVFIAISSSMIIHPFYLQYTMRFSPAYTGLLMIVYPLVMSVVAPVSGHLSDKMGSEILTFIGLLLNSVGLFLMSTLNEHTAIPLMVSYVALMSLGNGLFQSPNTSLIMSNAPKDMLGVAGSVNGLIRNLGMIAGISLAITILYSRMSSMVGYNVSDYIQGRDDVFIYGMKGAYITSAVICAAGALLTAFRLYEMKRNSVSLIKKAE